MRVFMLMFSTAWVMASGCLPYAVGMTAETVAQGEVVTGWSSSLVKGSNALRRGDAITLPTFDYEARWGIDPRTDYGVRVTSLSGVVGSVKRRFNDIDDEVWLSGQAEIGVVNAGQHAFGGATLLASSSDTRKDGVYGGVRVMAVSPIVQDAVYDHPTAGGFLGVRIATRTVDLYPELGVFHDRSALQLRTSDWIVVPSISVRVRADHIRRPRIPRRPPWVRPVS